MTDLEITNDEFSVLSTPQRRKLYTNVAELTDEEKEFIRKNDQAIMRQLALIDAYTKRMIVNWTEKASKRAQKATRMSLNSDLTKISVACKEIRLLMDDIIREVQKGKHVSTAVGRFLKQVKYEKVTVPKKRGRKPKLSLVEQYLSVFGVKSIDELQAHVKAVSEQSENSTNAQVNEMLKLRNKAVAAERKAKREARLNEIEAENRAIKENMRLAALYEFIEQRRAKREAKRQAKLEAKLEAKHKAQTQEQVQKQEQEQVQEQEQKSFEPYESRELLANDLHLQVQELTQEQEQEQAQAQAQAQVRG